MTLDKVAVGGTVKIARLNGAGPVKRRIMDMGLTRGTEVTVRKIAPPRIPSFFCAAGQFALAPISPIQKKIRLA